MRVDDIIQEAAGIKLFTEGNMMLGQDYEALLPLDALSADYLHQDTKCDGVSSRGGNTDSAVVRITFFAMTPSNSLWSCGGRLVRVLSQRQTIKGELETSQRLD